MAFEKVKRHKSQGDDKILVELFKAVGRPIRSEIHKLINFMCNKEELSKKWKESTIVSIYRKGDNTDFS
jgi:hypothetical protein